MKGDKVKPFYLLRHVDLSGTSGTGVVALGAVFPSGQVFLEWTASNHVSWNMFDNIEDVIAINGHEGNTEVIYGDVVEDKRKTKKLNDVSRAKK